MSDYDAGVAAAEAALEIMGTGQVVGLVGFATAQNAQDRIAGVMDTLAGTELEMVEVLVRRCQARSRVEQCSDRYSKIS